MQHVTSQCISFQTPDCYFVMASSLTIEFKTRDTRRKDIAQCNPITRQISSKPSLEILNMWIKPYTLGTCTNVIDNSLVIQGYAEFIDV